MKPRHLTAVVLLVQVLALLLSACGDMEDAGGIIGGDFVIPKGVLNHNVQKIQIIALKGSRDTTAILQSCQSDNLAAKVFSKSDMVKFYSGNDKSRSYVQNITADELQAGLNLKVEVETGTNYIFIIEIIADLGDGTSQVVANGSGMYQKVAKGSNKKLSVVLSELSPALTCSPLID